MWVTTVAGPWIIPMDVCSRSGQKSGPKPKNVCSVSRQTVGRPVRCYIDGPDNGGLPTIGTLEPLIFVLKIIVLNIFANNFPVYFSLLHFHYLHLSMSFTTCTISSSKITLATITFSTNQYCLLPSTADCSGTTISKLHSDDLQVYNTLEDSFGTLEAVMKLFCKAGEGQGSSGGWVELG